MSTVRARKPQPRTERPAREDKLAEVLREIRRDAEQTPREWLRDAEVPGGGE